MLHTGAMPQMNQQAGTYYVYPQMLDYLKRADIISVHAIHDFTKNGILITFNSIRHKVRIHNTQNVFMLYTS